MIKRPRLRGSKICVPRSELPQRDAKDFYRADLIGCEVVNLAGIGLGRRAAFCRDAGARLDGGARRAGILGAGRAAASAAGGFEARRVVVDWESERRTERMRIAVVSLFPQLIREALKIGVVGRALERGVFSGGLF